MCNVKFDFSDKTAVVTGGSGVLCSELCRELGHAGARVIVVANKGLDKAEALAEEIRSRGGNAVARQCNVLDRESLQKLADDTVAEAGKVDFLVNGAGGVTKESVTSQDLSFFDLPEHAVRWVFDLNFLGTFFACQVFGKVMVEKGGAILNFSSMSSLHPLTRSVAYSAAKAAVSNFTQWLAVHFSNEYNSTIRVNAVMPGFFITEQNRFLLTKENGELTERGEKIIEHTPMGRFGNPEDLTSAAMWLLSESARFVHGTTVTVDGGMSAYGGV